MFQFDPSEVRELRAALDCGEVRLSGIDFGPERDDPCRSWICDGRGAGAAERVETLRNELEELRAVAREAVDLFYLVCPARFLTELDAEVLDAFDAIASAYED